MEEPRWSNRTYLWNGRYLGGVSSGVNDNGWGAVVKGVRGVWYFASEEAAFAAVQAYWTTERLMKLRLTSRT